MSWQHVEDTQPITKNFYGWRGRTERGVSSGTLALSVWRCSGCRAFAVTSKGTQPTGDCGKCKNT